jgi:hypothetical protein
MGDIDRDTIERIVRAIGEQLDGNWLLVGGAALALWVAPRRQTEDVDIVAMTESGGERLALMELAEQLGLPIEAVNSAADFFVRRIEGWQDQIELLHQGTRSSVYRPNATLMLLLKMRRLSERDLEDCELVLGTGAVIDRARLLGALAELPAIQDTALAERRERLRQAIEASAGAGTS